MLTPDLAILFEVHGVLGPVSPILLYGTDEQKTEFLPKLAAGKLFGSFGLTEIGAGGDPQTLALTGELHDGVIRVDGNKCFITNLTNFYGPGLCALIFRVTNIGLKPGRDTVMALMDVPENLGDSLQIVRNDLHAFPGLFNARARFRSHPIPEERILGKRGHGVIAAFASLERGRMGICANSAGKIRRHVIELVGTAGHPKWVHVRETFRRLLIERPAVREYIGADGDVLLHLSGDA